MKVLLIGFMAIFSASSALACSCAEMVAKELVKDSDMLFVGFPTTDSVLTGEDDSDFGTKENMTKFQVTRGFINANSEVTLFSHDGYEASCGVIMKAYDGVYLISGYKNPESGKTHFDSCSLGFVGNEDTYKTIMKLEKLLPISDVN